MVSLSLLYTHGQLLLQLPEEGLPTQRVFSPGHSYPVGTMADSEDKGAAPILLRALVPQHD